MSAKKKISEDDKHPLPLPGGEISKMDLPIPPDIPPYSEENVSQKLYDKFIGSEGSQIAKAILAVMEELEEGIEKGMTVGTGRSAYKGVSDESVKKSIGRAMRKNGLCILPVGVKPEISVERYTENGQHKQRIFTSVITKYKLLHVSGESMELEGYGHGVDSQDKGAGKATTYALKYSLLYLFMVPTLRIDDADTTHSDDIPVTPAEPEKPAGPVLPWLNQFTTAGGTEETETWLKMKAWINTQESVKEEVLADIEKKYRLSKTTRAEVMKLIENRPKL